MKRSGPLRRSAPLRRTSAPRARRPEERALDARREALRAASYQCQAGTPACTLFAHHAHHRLMRSHGGGDTPENLLAVCPPCHRFIHDHPALAYERGWLIRGNQ